MSEKIESTGIVPREETLGLDATVSHASGSGKIDFRRLKNKPKMESTGVPGGPQAGDPCPTCTESGHASKLDAKRICPTCGWYPETEPERRHRTYVDDKERR